MSENTLKGKEWLAILAVVLLSIFLNICNNDFPLGYNRDELLKADFIQKNHQDFHHPMMLLVSVKTANLFFGFSEPQALIVLGRTVVGIIGGLIPLLLFMLSRRFMPFSYALAAAFGGAVSPILVGHAHYVKEDVHLTLGCLLSLIMLFRLIEKPGWKSVFCLGLSSGLAFSSHYKSFLLISIYVMAALWVPRGSRIDYARRLAGSLVFAFLVFTCINYPILKNPWDILEGMRFEAVHAVEGHSDLIHIPALPFFFTFHLTHSLLPGMTFLPLIFSLAGILFCLTRWRKTLWQEKIMMLYIFVFYMAVEISPLKPMPDFMRYVIPVVPVLLYFAAKTMSEISFKNPLLSKSKFILMILSITLPLTVSARLVYHMNKDTRETARRWVEANGGKALYETYASENRDTRCAACMDIPTEQKNGTRFLVASSFEYDRYYLGSRIKNLEKKVYLIHRSYTELFKWPYIEIKPRFKSFAYSNPVIRIVDIGPSLPSSEKKAEIN
jgi:4-amino-4-deoxy-L-arabinose transferase-like glycosyltransferase